MTQVKKTKCFFIIITVLLVVFINTSAQNLIAVQNGTNASFYSNLDSAIVHANNGSNIYIPGGSFTITQSIGKEVHIYGVGHNPDSTIATGISKILGGIIFINGSSNSSLEGVYIDNFINFGIAPSQPQTIENVLIKRCYIDHNTLLSIPNSGAISFLGNGGDYYNNIIITENVIINTVDDSYAIGTSLANSSNISNSFISNNYISSKKSVFSAIGLNCKISNNVINCLNSNFTAFYNIKGCDINNNIFSFNVNSYLGIEVNYCTFSKNLATGWVVGNSFNSIGNTFYNNIENQDFRYVFLDASLLSTFRYSDNYHLPPSSPGKNAGTDGTDIGFYGGQFSWKEGSVPSNPHIMFQNISGNANPNGGLPVNIKVAAQDH